MKSYSFLIVLLLIEAAVGAQTLQQNYGRQKYAGVPQPLRKVKVDSSMSRMPVIKPDTAVQEKMPVVKPPANIQSK